MFEVIVAGGGWLQSNCITTIVNYVPYGITHVLKFQICYFSDTKDKLI
jgi:hypothetical protein